MWTTVAFAARASTAVGHGTCRAVGIAGLKKMIMGESALGFGGWWILYKVVSNDKSQHIIELVN